MHRTAEYGIAAHWRYKETRGATDRRRAPSRSTRWRGCASCSTGSARPRTPATSWSRCASTWPRRRSSCSRPKGDVVTLPSGSTPVDLAYAVHTEVGHRCIGSRVNGKLVALERKLESGDVVEIFTSKADERRPEPRLAVVRRVAAGQDEDQAVVRQGAPRGGHRGGQGGDHPGGAAHLDAAAAAGLRRRDGRAGPGAALPGPVRALRGGGGGPRQRPARRAAAGRAARRRGGGRGGARRARHPVHRPAAAHRRRRRRGGARRRLRERRRHRLADLYTKLARCCTPVPGDEILGFVTRGGGISVHRTDCTNAADLQSREERLVEVRWSVSPGSVFLVAIQVEALDRHRLLSDITKVLADEKVNILSASVTTSRDRVAVSRFSLRDGRPEAPRPRAAGGAQRRGRLRRVPGHQRELSRPSRRSA